MNPRAGDRRKNYHDRLGGGGLGACEWLGLRKHIQRTYNVTTGPLSLDYGASLDDVLQAHYEDERKWLAAHG